MNALRLRGIVSSAGGGEDPLVTFRSVHEIAYCTCIFQIILGRLDLVNP